MSNANIKPRQRTNWSRWLRRASQAGFFLFILVASLRHNLLGESAGAASIDALCPMGGLATLWRMLTEGRYIPKTHPSNIVLGIGLLVGALFSGAAFCGWICPFGTLQDLLTRLRRALRLPDVRLAERLDRILRYGRFVVLALVLLKTIETVKLWFSGYDPYRTIFSLGWWFEFNWAEHWLAYSIALIVMAISFFIPRAWCKYACPLGGALTLVGHLSLLRIRREASDCKNCALCNLNCPVGIDVSKANPRVSPNCIGCLECVEACPRNNSLQVQLSPAWYDALRKVWQKMRRTGPKATP